MSTPPSLWLKTFVPCVLVLGCAAAAYFVWLDDPHPEGWPQWIASIGADSSPDVALSRAQNYLSLQTRSQVLEENSTERRQVADSHFQLAEALVSRNDSRWLQEAIHHYEEAARLVPTLRHGWLLFRWGNALQLAGEDTKARDIFRDVWKADSGRLALEAGYRALVLEAAGSDERLSAMPVYLFARYGTSDPLSAVYPLREEQWHPAPEALFTRALIAESQNQRDKAIALMSEFQRLCPVDPHAWVWLNEWQGIESPRLYPERDLLTAFHAPRALRSDVLRMPHDTQLRSAVFVPEGIYIIKLSWLYEVTLGTPSHEFYLTCNESRVTVTPEESQRHIGGLDATVSVNPGWNPIELHVFFHNVEPQDELPLITLYAFEITDIVSVSE